MQYSYEAGEENYQVDSSASSGGKGGKGGVRYPGKGEVFNVMGTGQSLYGTQWQVCVRV